LVRWSIISVNLFTNTEVSSVVPTSSPFSLIFAAVDCVAGADGGADQDCFAQAVAKTIPYRTGSTISARNGSKLLAVSLSIIILSVIQNLSLKSVRLPNARIQPRASNMKDKRLPDCESAGMGCWTAR